MENYTYSGSNLADESWHGTGEMQGMNTYPVTGAGLQLKINHDIKHNPLAERKPMSWDFMICQEM